MSAQRLINKSKNVELATEVIVARSLPSRLRGLLGRDQLATTSSMWIEPCNSIHTWFMKFSIDVVFVDQNLVVKKVCRNVAPWKMTLPVWGARSVFELAQGSAPIAKVEEGDQLYVGA